MAAAGLQIQNDDGNFGALHDRQNGGGERVGGDVEKNQVHIGLAKLVTGSDGFFGRIDQPQIDDIDSGCSEKMSNTRDVAFQAFLQTRELRPVSIEANTEEANGELYVVWSEHDCVRFIA